METYIRRAAKYAVYLIFLLFLIFAVMDAVSADKVLFNQLFTTVRGLYMAVVVLVFAAIYPFMGYVKRTLTFDVSQKVDEVANVMALCGYSRVDNHQTASLTFRATGKMKRFSMLGEDAITITTIDGLSVISGPRKEVVRAAFRFDTFIN